MWNFLKKRQEGDLRRVTSAFRFYLKSAHQTANHGISENEKEIRKWKGGFSKAFNQLFRDWPTPNQSKRFEKLMLRWVKKKGDNDQSFVLAFNDFLNQKTLNQEEIKEVLGEGKRNFRD